MRNYILLALIVAAAIFTSTFLWAQSPEIQFLITSDSHFGIARASFRGGVNVSADVVNKALVAKMNGIERTYFPDDGGLGASALVGPIDFIADTGDIANREEVAQKATIQRASESWAQFHSIYINGLSLLDRSGRKAPMFVVPGNHDVSNAIGHYSLMMPSSDKTSMVAIYNLMMAPAVMKTTSTYDYARDKVLASRDIGGIHFVFITIWPDSSIRSWMENDLRRIDPSTPVIIFAHDPPDSDSKHFLNPNGKHDINAKDKFENLLSESLADAIDGIHTSDAPPLIERVALEDFLHQHPNITAYFHGHNNWNEFYDWTGPNHTVMLHTFRLDSPMKGHFSALDEKLLSFQIATIDTGSRTMTVREVLWNADPHKPNDPVSFGSSTTVALAR